MIPDKEMSSIFDCKEFKKLLTDYVINVDDLSNSPIFTNKMCSVNPYARNCKYLPCKNHENCKPVRACEINNHNSFTDTDCCSTFIIKMIRLLFREYPNDHAYINYL